ncbi:hypothetical protein DdX_08733 [Ditylenchus destructor]|uniref:Uncharacterized protein n=1 Tax=Ditylenchus destructor TaxID=166010 RepID=A0AAD4N3S0_9BILA|nr:hypothetical protein DdX_08733 [Ditylenchus destructor]
MNVFVFFIVYFVGVRVVHSGSIYDFIAKRIANIPRLNISHHIPLYGTSSDDYPLLLQAIHEIHQDGVEIEYFSHRIQGAAGYLTDDGEPITERIPNELLPVDTDPCFGVPHSLACYGLTKAEDKAFTSLLHDITLEYIKVVSQRPPGVEKVKVYPVGILLGVVPNPKHEPDTPFHAVLGVLAKSKSPKENEYFGIAALLVNVHPQL